MDKRMLMFGLAALFGVDGLALLLGSMFLFHASFFIPYTSGLWSLGTGCLLAAGICTVAGLATTSPKIRPSE